MVNGTALLVLLAGPSPLLPAGRWCVEGRGAESGPDPALGSPDAADASRLPPRAGGQAACAWPSLCWGGLPPRPLGVSVRLCLGPPWCSWSAPGCCLRCPRLSRRVPFPFPGHHCRGRHLAFGLLLPVVGVAEVSARRKNMLPWGAEAGKLRPCAGLPLWGAGCVVVPGAVFRWQETREVSARPQALLFIGGDVRGRVSDRGGLGPETPCRRVPL